GEVEHVEDKDGKYVRLARKGWLEVAPDSRLDASAALTIEVWVRPTEPGILVVRQQVWMWGMILRVDPNSLVVDAFRTAGGPLRAEFTFPKDGWTHLVVAFGGSGTWKMYANGKLIGEREAMPAPVR
ncbi:MAG TPA: LamG-like jellyroll fold domain-containing protein, partial [Planctomycetota bacterium]|nr:LamG-like jellyroll fold domain-containing protein [Planctomycetota bacterium]